MANHNDEPHLITIGRWWANDWDIVTASTYDMMRTPWARRVIPVDEYHYGSNMYAITKRLSNCKEVLSDMKKGL